MPRPLALTDLGSVDARRWPLLTAGLVQDGRARLACARLSGGAIALGRFARSDLVLTARGQATGPVRRLTGGRTIALGSGQIAIALVLPHRSWLESDDPSALPAARLLNRSVRGVLSGLGRLGIAGYYFGRDFVTVDSAQAGYLSFDVTSQGVALVECVLAAEAHWWLPAECDALPPRTPVRGVPGPGAIAKLEGRTSAEVLAAIGEGYRERFGLEPVPDEAPIVEGVSIADPPIFPLQSRTTEAPCGFVEASVRLEAGRIAEASFTGELLGDSAGLQQLESAVVGCEPVLDALAPRLNAVYSDAGHTLLGVPDLGLLARLLLEACGR